MPMHQTDSPFHKKKAEMQFVFGYEADNHAINSTPKETLIRITKVEDGGLGGRGVWEPPPGPGSRPSGRSNASTGSKPE